MSVDFRTDGDGFVKLPDGPNSMKMAPVGMNALFNGPFRVENDFVIAVSGWHFFGNIVYKLSGRCSGSAMPNIGNCDDSTVSPQVVGSQPASQRTRTFPTEESGLLLLNRDF